MRGSSGSRLLVSFSCTQYTTLAVVTEVLCGFKIIPRVIWCILFSIFSFPTESQLGEIDWGVFRKACGKSCGTEAQRWCGCLVLTALQHRLLFFRKIMSQRTFYQCVFISVIVASTGSLLMHVTSSSCFFVQVELAQTWVAGRVGLGPSD